ncbi:MAG: hypothetical protein A2X94_08605 [Bdellovibrionales bacterium GWB1_55_8]|nr:MAG: hypothetical protein A2X94_08605 [Bdellovibrionales bacterium GWB1_55_8]
MGQKPKEIKKPASLRRRILFFVSGLIILSLFGSTISLFRITEVNRLLDAINRVSMPLGRLFSQMQSDADVFQREMERSLGFSHWKDPRWRPRPVPRWIEDILESEVDRLQALVRVDAGWTTIEGRAQWESWAEGVHKGLGDLRADAAKLYQALNQHDDAEANRVYPRWKANLDEWRRQLHWGADEYERMARHTFALAEKRVAQLRTGLEIIVAVVVLLSLLLLWLGEQALRPLRDLTRLAREITRRGLRKEDKALMPARSLSRDDEVSQLGREFHRMATALLEREKVVETQKTQLQEQNRLLRKMGELNQNVLNSIESVLLVTDLSGRITQINPVAEKWLGITDDKPVIGSELLSLTRFLPLAEAGARRWFEQLATASETVRIDACQIEDKTYRAHLMPLKVGTGGAHGAILVLDDVTEELDIQERLTRAENLAAVGRMSAQVAHEVRNPLHSIGLEAEMAVDMATSIGHIQLKQSLHSILGAVDRLEKITQNYLKLSKLSAGHKRVTDLGDVLESVLATYAPVCEAQGVRVDWNREERCSLAVMGDSDLLEQVIGNLVRNALQALEGVPAPRISIALGNAESGMVWVRIEDNGPGIPPQVLSKLFTPFVTTRSQGTGLGLSFVRKVAEEHGGSVRHVAEKTGGACFELLLPMLGMEMVNESIAAAPMLELETHG